MSFCVTFTIPLAPHGRANKAFIMPVKGDGRQTARIVKDTASRHHEKSIGEYALPFRPKKQLDGPVELTIWAIAQRPGRLMKKKDPDGVLWRPHKPDATNVRKGLEDAIGKKGQGWWRDDCQVVCGEPYSLYAEKDGRARLVVRVREVDWAPPAVPDTVSAEAFDRNFDLVVESMMITDAEKELWG